MTPAKACNVVPRCRRVGKVLRRERAANNRITVVYACADHWPKVVS